MKTKHNCTSVAATTTLLAARAVAATATATAVATATTTPLTRHWRAIVLFRTVITGMPECI